MDTKILRLLLLLSIPAVPARDATADQSAGFPERSGYLHYAPAPPDNPLKGFVSYPREQAGFPRSLEWAYTKLSDVMTGPMNFVWAPFERKLEQAAARGCQFIARFYLEWPGRSTGVPRFLLEAGVPLRTWTNTNTQPWPPAVDHTPDYEDPRLRAALTNFIHAFGARYDGDPAPLRNLVDPLSDGELGWRGGGLQIRIAADPELGWPVDANSASYYQMRRLPVDATQVAQATNPALAHLTLWHYAPAQQTCLHIAYGMDFHGGVVNPPGYRGAFRKDADGRGYTLEYAIPRTLLNAPRPPQPGDTLAMSWTVHWSDEGGRLWRGQLVELRNAAEPVRIHTWERAATWGRAVFR